MNRNGRTLVVVLSILALVVIIALTFSIYTLVSDTTGDSNAPSCGNGICERSDGRSCSDCEGGNGDNGDDGGTDDGNDGCLCTAIYAPVCGVDGKTYANECETDCNNIEVEHQGVCETGEIIKVSDVSYGELSEQKVDVYYGDSFSSAPMILVFHGGGGTKEGFGSYSDFFNDLGFVVVTVEYRLNNGVFPEHINDAACAVAWAKTNAEDFGGNPNEMFLLGHSGGAYSAAMIAYADVEDSRNWLEDCDYQTDLNIVGFIGSSGHYDFDSTNPERFEILGPQLGELYPDNYDEAEPINFVDANDPPAILLVGNDDCFSNKANLETGECNTNSVVMADKLEEAGVYVDLHTFDGYKHDGPKANFYTNEEISSSVINFVNYVLGL